MDCVGAKFVQLDRFPSCRLYDDEFTDIRSLRYAIKTVNATIKEFANLKGKARASALGY